MSYGLGEQLRIYHCVDDYAGYATDPRRTSLPEHAENETVSWADIVFTTSAHLASRLESEQTPVVALGNVADYAHFSDSSPDDKAERDLEDIPGPRLLFCGSFTQRKVDLDELAAVAEQLKARSF